MSPRSTDLHRVFPVEVRGNTLIVRPQGDSVGYGKTEIKHELETVRKLIEEEDSIRNLVIDLGLVNYFGTRVIGEMVSLAKQVREQKGGRAAICRVSSDMQGVLQLMKLDMFCEQHATESAALSAFAAETAPQRLWHYARPAMVYGGALLAIAALAYFFWPRPQIDRQRFEVIRSIWLDGKKLHRWQATRVEWSKLAKRSRRELHPLIEELESENPISARRQALLTAARNVNRLIAMPQRFDFERQQVEDLVQAARRAVTTPSVKFEALQPELEQGQIELEQAPDGQEPAEPADAKVPKEPPAAAEPPE